MKLSCVNPRPWRCVAAIGAWMAAAAHAAAPLPQLVIDPAQTSVSGLSSGGFMAVQLHVALSATFAKGAGIVAGGPFFCAEGSIVNATGRCMTHGSTIPVTSLVSTTKSWSASGLIDPVAKLANSKVYLYSGSADRTVVPAVMDDLNAWYRAFVPAESITYQKAVASGHGMVTDDAGVACGTTASPYINDCDFDLAGAVLQQLYGTLAPRNDGALGGRFVEFDQGAFVSGHGLAATGWVYVPQACAEGQSCRLHVVLHGCRQNTATIGDQYVRRTGYNRWADANRIVVLYPQTSSSAVNGCWDWWGYDSANYAKKNGPQIAAIKAMVDRLGSAAPPSSTLPPPSGVGTSGATSTSMVIAWSAVTGASGYNLRRGGAKVNASPIAATQATDTGLAPGTSYSWTVTALDAGDAENAPSTPANGTTTGSVASCFTASNYAHVAAGRAHQRFGLAYANGSNQSLGLWNTFVTRTLKQTGPNFFVLGTCP